MWIDCQANCRRARATLTIADGVGEAVGSVVVCRWRVGHRPVCVDHNRTVRRLGHTGHTDGVAVQVAVIAQHVDRRARVFIQGRCVGNRYWRSILCLGNIGSRRFIEQFPELAGWFGRSELSVFGGVAGIKSTGYFPLRQIRLDVFSRLSGRRDKLPRSIPRGGVFQLVHISLQDLRKQMLHILLTALDFRQVCIGNHIFVNRRNCILSQGENFTVHQVNQNRRSRRRLKHLTFIDIHAFNKLNEFT